MVDGPYAGDYYAMDGTYGTETTAVTGGCLYRCLKRILKFVVGVLKVFFVFESILFTESAIMVRSSVPATLKPHLEEESSIISVTTRMVGRFFLEWQEDA